jgi:hypothetical protein
VLASIAIARERVGEIRALPQIWLPFLLRGLCARGFHRLVGRARAQREGVAQTKVFLSGAAAGESVSSLAQAGNAARIGLPVIGICR